MRTRKKRIRDDDDDDDDDQDDNDDEFKFGIELSRESIKLYYLQIRFSYDDCD